MLPVGGMATGWGSNDIINGWSQSHSLASFLRYSGKRQNEESDAVAGRRGGHLAATYPGAEGGRPWLLHVPTQHQTHVKPAGMRGCPRYA